MSALAALAVINPLQVRHDPLLCPRGGWNPPPGIPSSLGELTVGISSAMAWARQACAVDPTPRPHSV